MQGCWILLSPGPVLHDLVSRLVVQPEVLYSILPGQKGCSLQPNRDSLMLSVLQGRLYHSSCMLSLGAHHGVGS